MIITNELTTAPTALREWENNTAQTDPHVDHPNHYNQGTVECIEAIDSCGFGVGFCAGNAMKYLWRFMEKGNAIQDLEKAQWYVDHLVKQYKNGEYTINGKYINGENAI